MRIVFLGDSLTWGGYGGDYVAEVARLLPDHTIMNAGVGGNTVVNLLNRLDSVLELLPDAVFVIVGGNDAISASQPDVRNYYRMTRGAPDGLMTPDIFTRAYRELLTQLQANYVQTWVGLESTEYSASLAAEMRRYNALAADICRSLNVPVLDLMAHFPPDHLPDRPSITEDFITLIGTRGRSGWSDYEGERQRGGYTWSFDGMHITPDTAQQLARLVVEFIDR